MSWTWLELLAGVLVAGLALLDVFGAVVVPGRTRLGLHTAGWIRRLVLPGWRKAAARPGRGSPFTLSAFAAFLLLSAFLSWVLLVLLGFGLMVHALRAEFQPPLASFAEALYQTGSAMMTLGLSGHTATGAVRFILVLAGLSGLQIVTLGLTYILQVQSALQARDAAVIMLSSRGGSPPSGFLILETQARLGLTREIAGFFLDWERWAAQLLYSHTAHPVLGYFRSPDRDNDWLDALAAALEAAALMLALVDDDGNRGRAELFFRTASRAARDLCAQYGLTPREPPRPGEAAVGRLRDGLAAVGYRVHDMAGCCDGLADRREAYAGHIEALVEHFGVRRPAWS